MHEADTDTMATDLIPAGRHRLRSAPLRRAVGRMSLGAGAVVLTIVVGVLAAVGTGLTDDRSDAADSLSAPPVHGRTGLPSAPATRAEAPATVEPAPEPTAEPVPAHSPEVDAPDPAPVTPSPAAAPEPVPTVRPGDPCPVEGAVGLTADGKAVVCTNGRGNGRTKWRVS